MEEFRTLTPSEGRLDLEVNFYERGLETVRETIVCVAAAAAAKSFKLWRTMTTRHFPDDKTALLAWIADVGAPQVFRSYEVFLFVAKRLSSRYDTLPAPRRAQFEGKVAAYRTARAPRGSQWWDLWRYLAVGVGNAFVHALRDRLHRLEHQQ